MCIRDRWANAIPNLGRPPPNGAARARIPSPRRCSATPGHLADEPARRCPVSAVFATGARGGRRAGPGAPRALTPIPPAPTLLRKAHSPGRATVARARATVHAQTVLEFGDSHGVAPSHRDERHHREDGLPPAPGPFHPP